MKLIRKQTHLDITQAKTLCAEWQELLRLQDWFIDLRIVRGDDLRGASQGECEWVLPRRSSIIKLLDPIDWPTTCIEPQDMEVTLVHELLHLSMASFDDRIEKDSPYDTAMEQHINAVSHALVSAKRAKP